jgi:hypothetical protein
MPCVQELRIVLMRFSTQCTLEKQGIAKYMFLSHPEVQRKVSICRQFLVIALAATSSEIFQKG